MSFFKMKNGCSVSKLLFQPQISPELWLSEDSICYLNTRLPELEKVRNRIEQIFSECCGEVPSLWVLSSGTTSKKDIFKVKVISKKNFLAAANSFNDHFRLTSADRWLRALPLFHVGGLAIHARSFLSGAQVVQQEDLNWNPKIFYEKLVENKITFCSLVPAQLFDLVSSQLTCPDSVRAVFIGGAALSQTLKMKAVELGWPIYESFGMTETSSMVACKERNQISDFFQPLPGVRFQVNELQQLFIQAPGRLDFEWTCDFHGGNEMIDFRPMSLIPTQDTAQLEGPRMKFLGRKEDMFKVGGELVSLHQLQAHWDLVTEALTLKSQSLLTYLPDERLENIVILVSEDSFANLLPRIQKFNESVLPFERIRRILNIPSLPRNSLGKIQKNQLQEFFKQGELREI